MKKRLSVLALAFSMLVPFLKAEDYGLPDEIPQGNILHAFSWPIKYIREELPNIAAAGFGAIQISPVQRPDINEGWVWYDIYLPYDYHVMNSPGMGTKDDLKALCEEAADYGIKIVVDVVLNHVNKTSPHYNPWFKDGSRYRYWGSEGREINYDNRYSITHDPLGDYVELNTENQEVIDRAKAYVQELKDLGVKGVRFDAAKHMELPSEVSDGVTTGGVWPSVTSIDGMWYYGEIVGEAVNGSDDKITEYSSYDIWVPEPSYTATAAKENGGVPKTYGGGRNSLTDGKLVYYGESHDDYSNDEWSEKVNQGVIDRAYCAYACRNTQTALYYSRPRARLKDNIKIEKGSTAFMGKHIVEVNKFRNAMVGKEDYFSCNDDQNACSITRKDGGAVIIMKGSGWVGVANGGNYCPDGTYTDRVSGGIFTVKDGGIEGTVGPSGVAVIYKNADYKDTPTPATVTITGDEVYNVAYAGNFSNGNNYIHYWKNDSYTTTWPGVEMKRALGSDGNYYWCYNVPAGVDGIVFNNGDGSDAMQSGDLPLVSDFIMDNGGATITPVTFKQGTFASEPAASAAKTVRIEGNYNVAFSGEYGYVYYWNSSTGDEGKEWPGDKMTSVTGDDGNAYQCHSIPDGYDYVIFNDGSGEQTGDLAYSGAYVMSEAGATEVNVIFSGQAVQPDPEPTPDPSDVEVEEPAAIEPVWPTDSYCYFVNGNNWSDVKAYYWIDDTKSADWPGEIYANKVADKFCFKMSFTPAYVIFNDGNSKDGNQTEDLSFVNAATYYPDGGHIGGEDNAASNPSRLYVLGDYSGNNWSTNSASAVMDKTDKGLYVFYGLEIAGEDNGCGYFSFADALGTSDNANDWDNINSLANRFGAISDNLSITPNSPSHITRYGKGDAAKGTKSWKVANGTYDVVVDLYDMTVILLNPQTAPAVTALQLVEVRKGTAASAVSSYDYITYPSAGAYGIKVDSSTGNITAVEGLSGLTEDFYCEDNNVRFTDMVLVATTFTATNSEYGLEPQTASYSTLQNGNTFYGFKTLDNLNENAVGSKVNYYYTIHEGVDVKVSMQTPVGSGAVALVVPEPKLINAGIAVTHSGSDTKTFTYRDFEFDALYSEIKKVVEVEAPNITESLASVAGDNLYTVTAPEGMALCEDGYSYAGDVLSPKQVFFSYEPIRPSLETGYESAVTRWEVGSGNVTSSVAMTYDAPTVNGCEVTYYSALYTPVEVAGKTEQHLIETTVLTLDMTSAENSIISKGDDGSEIKSDALNHSGEGDWYLVEVYKGEDKVASAVAEGGSGPKEFVVTRDFGQWYDGQLEEVLDNRLYSGNPTVRVSALYPFAAISASSSSSRRRSDCYCITSPVVESEASEAANVRVGDEIVTGVEAVYGAADGEAEYFNAQGIRVSKPEAPGVYVVREANGRTHKIVVR